jgi:hypothetical protein
MDKNFAKVQLSSEQMRLVTDPGWILTKNSIMGKVVAMFAELSGEWRAKWELAAAGSGLNRGQELPLSGQTTPLRSEGQATLFSLAGPAAEPKISKGENYKGLPWVMLDCPRVFGKEDVLAIRTMFWWGHAFSLTLHLKGRWKRLFLPVIAQHLDELAATGFHLGVMEDEWEHGHTAETYRPLEGALLGAEPLGQGLLEEKPRGSGLELVGDPPQFLKISAKVALESWAEAPELLTAMFETLLRVLLAPDAA